MSSILVPASDVPRKVGLVSIADPVTIFKKFSTLQAICLRENGLGLAAVQLGVPENMFVVKKPDGDFQCFLNMKYTSVTEEIFISCEGCLSLPNRLFLVPRYKTIRIKGLEMIVGEEINFVEVDLEIDDPLNVAVMQHEIGHCFGEMIDEIGREIRIRTLK